MVDLNLEEIGKHYLVAALWTEQEEIEDKDQSDLSDAAKQDVTDSVAKFVQEAGMLLECYAERVTPSPGYSVEAQMGHDIWLTRNRHGAGFWDRGLEDLGVALTNIAQELGEVCLIVGDDGKLYFE